MDLLLIRHAEAVPKDIGAVLAAQTSARAWNAARPLTKRGRAQLRRIVRALEHLGVSFDRMYHSPKLRSIETADGLVDLLHGESIVTRRLCGPPSEALLKEISGERVAVVGHEPHLSALVALLVAKGADVSLTFKPAGVAWLAGELRLGGMHVHALLPPKVLRALAER